MRKGGRDFANMTPAARHELRIRFKKLRYGTEFFASLFPGREVDRFRNVVARMQDLLGQLNDVAVAQHVLNDLLDDTEPGARQRTAALGAGQVIGWYAHQSCVCWSPSWSRHGRSSRPRSGSGRHRGDRPNTGEAPARCCGS